MKLTVWHIPQVPGPAFKVPVASPEEGKKILTVLAAYDSFEFGQNVKGDYSNAGGLLDENGDEWEDPETGTHVRLDSDTYVAIQESTGGGMIE